jgi:hypothetical protein
MSYTTETLETTLQKYDDIIKTAILEGNIGEVMTKIDPEIVSKRK